jgi:hypothetical protein
MPLPTPAKTGPPRRQGTQAESVLQSQANARENPPAYSEPDTPGLDGSDSTGRLACLPTQRARGVRVRAFASRFVTRAG